MLTYCLIFKVLKWWTIRDSNPRPTGYEPGALTNWANGPLYFGAEDRNRTGTRGKSRRILSPVRLPVPPLRHFTWLCLTLPGGCPPSTISAKELNFCVRNGNRCILFAIVTTLNCFVFQDKYYINIFIVQCQYIFKSFCKKLILELIL